MRLSSPRLRCEDLACPLNFKGHSYSVDHCCDAHCLMDLVLTENSFESGVFVRPRD